MKDTGRTGQSRAVPTHSAAKRAARRVSGWAVSQRIVAVIVAVFALGSLVFLFLPRVTVVVSPVARVLERTLTIPLSDADGGQGVVARLLEINVEATVSVPASGRRQQGVAAATGTVIIFNETDKEIVVPAETPVGTDGDQRFIITRATRVPARRAEYFMDVPVGIKAGQVEAAVRATQLGNGGNVAAGRITSLPDGPAGLRVVNPEATRGGVERSVAYATQDDVNSARKQLTDVLRRQGEKQLESQIGEQSYLIRPRMEVQEVDFVARPAAGETTDAVHATLRGKARGRYVLMEDVRRFVHKEANGFVPKGYSVLGSPVVSMDNNAADVAGELAVSARIFVGGAVDDVAISRLVAGRTPEHARRLLLETGEVGDMRVVGRSRKRLPSWTPWIRVVVSSSADDNAEVTGL